MMFYINISINFLKYERIFFYVVGLLFFLIMIIGIFLKFNNVICVRKVI